MQIYTNNIHKKNTKGNIYKLRVWPEKKGKGERSKEGKVKIIIFWVPL